MHKSTGNDIVDLRSVDKTRTSEPRFYSKIISEKEKELYLTSPGLHLPFDVFVWLAWSVKESVYKFLKRHAPLLVFSPTKIVLDSITFEDGVSYGIVMFRDDYLLFRTEITDEWLHSIVLDQPGVLQGISGVKRINPTSNSERSVLAWEYLLEEVKKELGEDVGLKKSELGYPVIIRNGNELDIPVSLSHDGDFAAFSMRI